MLKSDRYTPEQIQTLINKFTSRESDIEKYLKENSIRDSLDKKTITYLILDKDKDHIKFYFTIIAKPISLIGISNENVKYLLGDSRKSVTSAMLIAQLGKDETKSFDITADIFWNYINVIVNERLDFKYPLMYLECKSGWHKEYYNKFGFIELNSDVSKDLITMYKPNRI